MTPLEAEALLSRSAGLLMSCTMSTTAAVLLDWLLEEHPARDTGCCYHAGPSDICCGTYGCGCDPTVHYHGRDRAVLDATSKGQPA